MCNSEKTRKPALSKESHIATDSIPLTSKSFSGWSTFLVISDWGWNGYKHQSEVAAQLDKTADSADAKFIVSCGDNFQVSGVASTSDPLWSDSFENVYKGISLQVDWFPVLGNHDYKGNTKAEIEYSKISRRWRMTDHYYSITRKINDSVSARLIFLDTPPLVSEYYKRKAEYPDIMAQDSAKQLEWLKKTLSESKEQWKIVFGHHPVFSASQKHGNTPELIRNLKPVFEKYHVQMYFCGHDHDFQHLHEKGKDTEYFVTGTGGEPRPASKNEFSLFSKSVPGFSAVSFKGDSLKVMFINSIGGVEYGFSRRYLE